MKKFFTLCLVLLTAAALTVPAYADVIAEPTPMETLSNAAHMFLPLILVFVVVETTIFLLKKFWTKK